MWINHFQIQNREYNALQISDLADKIEQAEQEISQRSFIPPGSGDKKKKEDQLSKVVKDRCVVYLLM